MGDTEKRKRVELIEENQALRKRVAELEKVSGERDKITLALKHEELRFQSVVQSATDAIIVSDNQGKIIFWNKGAENLFGYGPEEILNKPLEILMPQKYIKAHHEAFTSVISGGPSHIIGSTVELSAITKNQEEIPIELSLASWEFEGRLFFTGIIRNISNRRKAEVAVQQVMAQLELRVEQRTLELTAAYKLLEEKSRQQDILLDAIPAIIFCKNLKSHYIVVNQMLVDFLNLPRAEILGKTDFELVTLEQAESFRHDDTKVMSAGETIWHIEERVISADGKTSWVSTTKTPYRDQTGQVIGMIGVSFDISQRKAAEEALRESEERYRRLVEYSPEAIAVHSGGFIVYANTAATRLFKAQSPDQLLGKQLLSFVHPEYHGYVLERVKQTQEEGKEAVLSEAKLIRLDGEVIDVETVGLPLAFHGKPATQVVIRDITENKRIAEVQRFLAEASTLLAGSLDYQVTLKLIVDLAVPFLADWCMVDFLRKDGSFDRVAVAAKDKANEQLTQDLHRNYKPLPEIYYGVSVVASTGKSQIIAEITDQQLQMIARDAPHLAMLRAMKMKSWLIVPLIARGNIIGTISFVISATERRYNAQDLQVAEELAHRSALAVDNARLYEEAREAIRVRDEFLSVAAHELKTPITSLRGYAQFLQHQFEKNGSLSSPNLRIGLLTIERQSTKLAYLINQLLNFSRVQSGRLILELTQVELINLLTEVIVELGSTTTKHTITLHSPEAVWVTADPVRLEQVFTNLLDNALKYSPEGGPIDVYVTIALPREVQIEVWDKGIGIPVEEREHIFDRFYRAHGSSFFSGMGLGLFISKEIIDLHHGRIEVSLPSEGGTKFRVSLPLDGKPA